MITQKNFYSNENERDKPNNENISSEINNINKSNSNTNNNNINNNKSLNEPKQQKNFLIKKKKSLKRVSKNEKKKDDFYDHFKEIIAEIEKEEKDTFNTHQSDEYEEGRSDSESSSDDLEVIKKLLKINMYIYFYFFQGSAIQLSPISFNESFRLLFQINERSKAI